MIVGKAIFAMIMKPMPITILVVKQSEMPTMKMDVINRISKDTLFMMFPLVFVKDVPCFKGYKRI